MTGNTKKIMITVVLLGIPLVLRALGKAAATAWAPVVPYPMLRSDTQGDGQYGASRGDRLHQGVDVQVYEGEPIYAPIDGVINRVAYPYANDLQWRGLEMSGADAWQGYSVKMFYMSPEMSLIGKPVSRGQVVGKAQAISKKYTPAMKDHLHVEIRKDGALIDPTPFIFTN